MTASTAGNCPWRLMTNGVVVSENWVNTFNGTWPPVNERMSRNWSAWGPL